MGGYVQSKLEEGMRFKELTLFNYALLAKQTWRLLPDKNSLLYRVFKSKFFPNCSVMEAKDSQMGSQAWRSILKGRDVIKQGARWRIGNGNSVNVWFKNWLPSLSYPKILSPLIDDAQEITVNSFINPFTRQREVGLLNSSFSPTKVELIKKILLSNHFIEDVLFWPYVQSGVYSIKSGYQFLKGQQSQPQVPQDVSAQPQNFWRKIWVLKTPSKVKNFIWTACKNAIPTNMNLVRRTMIESGVCSLCSQEEEDILCAIWSCPCLAGVWGYDDQWTFQEGENFVSFSNLVSFIVESNLNFELFATVSWSIQNRRNLVRISSLALPLDQVFHGALSFLQEYQNAQPCLTSSPPRPPTIW